MSSQVWFFYALVGYVLWGIGYVLSEKVLRMGLPPAFILFFDSLIVLPIFFILAASFGEIKNGFNLLWTTKDALTIAVLSGITIIGGNFLIILSVSKKNATLASLVEISYPLFTFVFAYLILKEVQLNWGAALGGLLIFSGIAVIYFKN